MIKTSKAMPQLELLNPVTPATRIFEEEPNRDLACRKELFNESFNETDMTEHKEPEKKTSRGRKPAKGLRTFWTKEEDQRLIQSVNTNDACQWTLHAQHVGNGRTSKQCRERWHNHLAPGLKKSNWTDAEDAVLVKAHTEGLVLNGSWADIAKSLPGRTDNAVKNRWNLAMQRAHKFVHNPSLMNLRHAKTRPLIVRYCDALVEWQRNVENGTTAAPDSADVSKKRRHVDVGVGKDAEKKRKKKKMAEWPKELQEFKDLRGGLNMGLGVLNATPVPPFHSDRSTSKDASLLMQLCQDQPGKSGEKESKKTAPSKRKKSPRAISSAADGAEKKGAFSVPEATSPRTLVAGKKKLRAINFKKLNRTRGSKSSDDSSGSSSSSSSSSQEDGSSSCQDGSSSSSSSSPQTIKTETSQKAGATQGSANDVTAIASLLTLFATTQ